MVHVELDSLNIRVATTTEYTQVEAMLREGHPRGTVAAETFKTTVAHDPAFRPEHVRVAVQSRQIVSASVVIDRTVRIGAAQLRCAIIMTVVGLPEERHRGTAAALMRAVLKWANSAGYHVALSWGHGWLYPQWGFAPAFKGFDVHIHDRFDVEAGSALQIRPMVAADLGSLLSIYERETVGSILAPVRSAALWEWRTPGSEERHDVVVDPAHLLRGYARWSGSSGNRVVHELFVADDHAAAALTTHLMGDGQTTLLARVAPDTRWARWAWSRGAEVISTLGRQEVMLRILDAGRLLQALLPELERRVTRSEYAAHRGLLRLITPVGTVGIQVERGHITIGTPAGPAVSVTFPVLSALVSGYRPFVELLHEPGVNVEDAQTIRLLEVLFPAAMAYWPGAPFS
ncbi:MAG: hypothetical protein NVS4B8_08370 [Herpetosiphon sp.]